MGLCGVGSCSGHIFHEVHEKYCVRAANVFHRYIQRVLARVSHSHDKIGVKFAFSVTYYRASDGLLIVYVSLVAVYKFRFPIREFLSGHGTIACRTSGGNESVVFFHSGKIASVNSC